MQLFGCIKLIGRLEATFARGPFSIDSLGHPQIERTSKKDTESLIRRCTRGYLEALSYQEDPSESICRTPVSMIFPISCPFDSPLRG